MCTGRAGEELAASEWYLAVGRGKLCFSRLSPLLGVRRESCHLHAKGFMLKFLRDGNGVVAVEAVTHELAHIAARYAITEPHRNKAAVREVAKAVHPGFRRDKGNGGCQYPRDDGLEVVGPDRLPFSAENSIRGGLRDVRRATCAAPLEARRKAPLASA
jgi:hypothetical protein